MTEAARRDVLYRSAASGLRRSRLSKYGADEIYYNARVISPPVRFTVLPAEKITSQTGSDGDG